MPETGAVQEQRRATQFDVSLPQCPGLKQRTFAMGGVEWRVCEQRASSADGESCLLFYGPGLARRVRCYPPHWDSLTDSELYALSWQR